LIKEGREAVDKQDDEQVTAVSERLEAKAHEMASKLYEGAEGPDAAAAAAAAGGDSAPPADEKGDVIDAEFEEN
jgi:molecular chaperone DnaK